MSITFSNPTYLFFVLVPIPVILFLVVKSKKVLQLIKNYSSQANLTVSITSRLWARIIFWTISWFCLSIALAGPSWGTEQVPVQKSGCAASFVFDISYSMMANDASNSKMNRLKAAQDFSNTLLSNIQGVATSAVIAKGDGFLAVPLTEDYYSLSNVINALSPYMLSSPGSSIAKGIYTAIKSFPPQSARNSYIFVFTDGDETDNNLSSAVQEAVTYGINVIFVGFGSIEETDVLAGDGKTLVKTSLKADLLAKLAEHKNIEFFLGAEESSLHRIVEILYPSVMFSDKSYTTSYELRSKERHSLFIIIAIVSFLLGFIVFTIAPLKNTYFSLFVIFASSIFSGCNVVSPDTIDILQGTYNWNQKNYNKAIVSFLEVNSSNQLEETESRPYSQFGLSACYIMQDELEASLTKINEMDPVVSESLDFARWYNKGIIFHRKGESEIASFCFKKALLIDDNNIDAKINLELCLDERKMRSTGGVQERIPAKEQKAPPGADNAIFSLIKEKESDKWKASETVTDQESVLDY